jgi:hypothetical protein
MIGSHQKPILKKLLFLVEKAAFFVANFKLQLVI